MNYPRSTSLLLAAALVAVGSSTAWGQIKRPGPPTPWNLFGGNQAFAKARDATANRRGNRPNMEREAPLKRIADPANLQPEIAPGMKTPEPIKVAAQVKTQEDLKEQKIKGLKYLGTICCGCYAKKYDIEGALLEGLDDCTEEVRYEAVMAIMGCACGDMCKFCNKENCCTPKILEKLAEMAYKQDKEGCWSEPSARVRSAAAGALNACYPHLPPEQGREGIIPERGGPRAPGAVDPAPNPGTTTSGANRRLVAPPMPAVSQKMVAPNHWALSDVKAPPVPGLPPQISAVPVFRSAAPQTNASASAKGGAAQPKAAAAQTKAPAAQTKAPAGVSGSVQSVDVSQRLVALKLDKKAELPVGTRLRVYHRYLAGRTALTDLEVVESSALVTIATPLDMEKFAKVSRGDEVETIK